MDQATRHSSTFPPLVPQVGALITTFVAGLFVCPLLALGTYSVIPRVVRNFLFFWPQLALVLFGFTLPARDMTRTYLGGGWNFLISGMFWLLIGIVLSWLLRKQPIRVIVCATLPVSFAIAIAVAALLYQLNIGIYLEGP